MVNDIGRFRGPVGDAEYWDQTGEEVALSLGLAQLPQNALSGL